MRLRWEPSPAPERRRLRRGRTLNGVHAVAIRRQLAWAKEFAQAGDLASALDAASATPERSHRSWGAWWTPPPSRVCE